MTKQSSKDQLLKDIHTQHRLLEKNLSNLSADDMILPGVTGTWSGKDILAHLAAWEKLFMEWYSSGLQSSTPAISPVGMSRRRIDELNQQIFDKNHTRNLDAILSEFYTSYQMITALIEEIPEEDMFARGRFKWTGKLTLADYIAGNTCSHYAWASSQIRKWKRHLAEVDKQR